MSNTSRKGNSRKVYEKTSQLHHKDVTNTNHNAKIEFEKHEQTRPKPKIVIKIVLTTANMGILESQFINRDCGDIAFIDHYLSQQTIKDLPNHVTRPFNIR